MVFDQFENRAASFTPSSSRSSVRVACLVLAGLTIAPVAVSYAEDSSAPNSATPGQGSAVPTEAPDVTTKGDYFKFSVNVEHFKPSDADRQGEVTAPPGSCFRVSQELDITVKDPSDPSKTTTQKMVRGRFETGWLPNFPLPPYQCADTSSLLSKNNIDANLSYDVPKNMILEERDRTRFGWTYGVLAVPFKYYTTAREFSASATVGPYLGYRVWDRQGSSSVFAVAVGAAGGTVTTNNPDGTTSSSSETGWTLAGAYLLQVKDAFNVGFVAGSDFFSKSQNVPTSGKLWLGLSFGYKLN